MDVAMSPPRFLLGSVLVWSALTGCGSSVPGLDDGSAATDAIAREDSLPDGARPVDARPVRDGATADAGPGLVQPFAPCGVVGVARIERAVPSPDGALIALATHARQVVLVSARDGAV